MAVSVVNIDLAKAFSYCIHGPHYRISMQEREANKGMTAQDDTYPLYARSDKVGYQGRTQRWLQEVEKRYNSPRNVRALAITKQGIAVQYYHMGTTDRGTMLTGSEQHSRAVITPFKSVPLYASGVGYLGNTTFAAITADGYYLIRQGLEGLIELYLRGCRKFKVNSVELNNGKALPELKVACKDANGNLSELPISQYNQLVGVTQGQARVEHLYTPMQFNTWPDVKLKLGFRKAFDKDWALSNLEEFYIDESLLLDCSAYEEGTLAQIFNNQISNGAPYMRATDLVNSVCVPSLRITGLYNKGLSDNDLAHKLKLAKFPIDFSYYLKVNMNGLEKNYDESANFVFITIARLLCGGERVDFNKGVFKDYPRLKTIGFGPLSVNQIFRWSPEDSIETVHRYAAGASEAQLIDSNVLLMSTAVNLLTAKHRSDSIWKFDNDFLKKRFTELEKRYAEDFIFAYRCLPKSGGNVSDLKSTLQPPVDDNKPDEKDSKSDNISQEATNKVEISLNRQYASSKKRCISTLRVLRDTYGVDYLTKEFASFTDKGRELYTSLLASL